jgi:hypothetical protein
MSRTAPRITAFHWIAGSALGLALAAAMHAHAGTIQTAPAAQQKATVHRVAQHGREDAYALAGGDERGATMTGNSADAEAIEQIRRSIKGEFLWFRDGGRSWIVQDPDTVARARAAWAPVKRLGEQMNAHGKDMEQHGKAMEGLGQQMGRASEDERERLGGKMASLGQRMDALGKQMEALGKQMERESDAADRTVRGLIRNALAGGLAQQAPVQG